VADRILAFDAGTGLIGLGDALLARTHRLPRVDIFLSHYHHDHIEGLRFFTPLYECGWECRLYGPKLRGATVERSLRMAMAPPFFPVQWDELPARTQVRSVADGEVIRFSGPGAPRVRVALSSAHPKLGVALYRVEYGGRALVYATDLEAIGAAFDLVVEFSRGAQVLVHDAQYTDEEYSGGRRPRTGWGHSTIRIAAEVARAAGVERLFLYHHDPAHSDQELAHLLTRARAIFPASELAREGLRIDLAPAKRAHPPEPKKRF